MKKQPRNCIFLFVISFGILIGRPAIQPLFAASCSDSSLSCDDKIMCFVGDCMQQNPLGGAACRAQAERQANCSSNLSSRPTSDVPGSPSTPSSDGINQGLKALTPAAETLLKNFSTDVRVAATEVQCMAVFERNSGLVARAEAFEQFNARYLGPLGNVLRYITVQNLMIKGQTTAATQIVATSLLDTVVCTEGGGAVCAPWMFGRTLGSLLSEGPKMLGISDISVNDWWTDKLAEFMNPGPTEADFRRFEAEAAVKIAAARQAAESKSGCDPATTVGKAGASPNPSTKVASPAPSDLSKDNPFTSINPQ